LNAVSLLKHYVYVVLFIALAVNVDLFLRLSVVSLIILYGLFVYPGVSRFRGLVSIGVVLAILVTSPLLLEAVLGYWSIVSAIPVLLLVDLLIRE